MRLARLLLLPVLLLGALAAATPAAASPVAPVAVAAAPIGSPGKVAQIRKVSSTTADGWRFDFYENPAYPCSVSGENTFTIATRLGVPDDEVHPLWVFMHGGGVGYFDATGKAQPSNGQKVEEDAALQQRNALNGGLKKKVAAAPAGFRMMAVSMCNHDIYGGGDTVDPNNPNRDANGKLRTVNGLFATKAAIQFALTTRATDDYFLHGGSAGSFGSFHVGWSLEEQGIAPTGIIGDSGVLNQAWQLAVQSKPACGRTTEALATVQQRLHPDVGSEANQPHHLVEEGRLTVPLLQVWSIGDPGQCGTDPIACPLPDGSTPTMGSVDCLHEPLRAAIEEAGDERSDSMRLCVDNPNQSGTCDRHVPSGTEGATNTIGPWPADYQTAMMSWVTARLGDDGSAPPADRSATASFATAARTDFLGSEPDPRRVEADALALDAGLARSTYLTRLSTTDEWLAAVVDQMYQDTLGRPGDPSGTAFWINQLRTGRRTVAQAAASFYASSEYYRGFGGGTDRTWVADLYPKLLGRTADAGGLDYWTRQTGSAGRDSVARRFFQSPESARNRVRGLYQDLLGRSPDPSGLAYWSGRVVTDGDLALAVQLAASNEYRNRASVRFP